MEKGLKFILRYVYITLSCLVYAVAIALFLNPNNLAPGGVSGIAIILKAVLPMLPEVGMIIIIINIPILILGAWKFGLRFVMSTLYTVIVSSAMIDIVPKVINKTSITTDPMLAAIIGGALMGISMGIMFKLETTTGGFDVIVKVIRQKYTHMRTGELFMIADCAVLVGSMVAFHDIVVGLYAAIAIYVSSLILDRTLYGSDEATQVHIISEKRRDIADRILKDLDLGVTYVQGIGAYSAEPKEIVMCVMRKQNLAKVRKIVKEIDPDAFMIVSTVNEVFGEGFKDQYKSEI